MSLENIGQSLTRDEMREVMAGSSGGQCYNNANCWLDYCIETDGVAYGVWWCTGSGSCVESNASYCYV